MQVILRTYGGKPLVILLGHEDFDLIFVVNQIAEIGHITNPSAATAMTMEVTGGHGFLQLREVLHLIENPEQVGSWGLEHTPGDTWLASSAASYRMLLRLDSPIEEFFQRWLIDTVLPEVHEMMQTGRAVRQTDADLDECEQLRATVRKLERWLSREIAQAQSLERSLQIWDRKLVELAQENSALRKGVPGANHSSNTEDTFLSRVQAEFDDLSLKWRLALKKDEIALGRARIQERWLRKRPQLNGR